MKASMPAAAGIGACRPRDARTGLAACRTGIATWAVLLLAVTVAACTPDLVSRESHGVSSGAPMAADGSVTVVNRTTKPLDLPADQLGPACAEVRYDLVTARRISDAWMERAQTPPSADDTGPRLDAFIAPSRGTWYILVTTDAAPGLYFDGAEVPIPGVTAEPRPAAWPVCGA